MQKVLIIDFLIYGTVYDCRELQDRLAKTDQQMQKLQSWSLTQLVTLIIIYHFIHACHSFIVIRIRRVCLVTS